MKNTEENMVQDSQRAQLLSLSYFFRSREVINYPLQTE